MVFLVLRVVSEHFSVFYRKRESNFLACNPRPAIEIWIGSQITRFTFFTQVSIPMKDKAQHDLGPNAILENMKKNDKFIGDILAPFEQALGMKFNKFDKPEDPKFVEPKKKKSLKFQLMQAEKKQQRLQTMDPKKAKVVHWKNAIDKARGIKIKDDPKTIKKVMKRKLDEKKRHKKKWAERVEKQEVAKTIKEKKKRERIQKSKADKGKKKKRR